MNQSVEYQRVDFRRADTRARVYELELVNTKTTFQFSKQFFIRGIAQYDSLRERVLSDFLASYELRPGTVAYAGYGSLIVLGMGEHHPPPRRPPPARQPNP